MIKFILWPDAAEIPSPLINFNHTKTYVMVCGRLLSLLGGHIYGNPSPQPFTNWKWWHAKKKHLQKNNINKREPFGHEVIRNMMGRIGSPQSAVGPQASTQTSTHWTSPAPGNLSDCSCHMSLTGRIQMTLQLQLSYRNLRNQQANNVAETCILRNNVFTNHSVNRIGYRMSWP